MKPKWTNAGRVDHVVNVFVIKFSPSSCHWCKCLRLLVIFQITFRAEIHISQETSSCDAVDTSACLHQFLSLRISRLWYYFTTTSPSCNIGPRPWNPHETIRGAGLDLRRGVNFLNDLPSLFASWHSHIISRYILVLVLVGRCKNGHFVTFSCRGSVSIASLSIYRETNEQMTWWGFILFSVLFSKSLLSLPQKGSSKL